MEGQIIFWLVESVHVFSIGSKVCSSKHTRNLVPNEKQKVHIEMCEVWRNSKSYEMASKQASTIRQWWSTGNVLTENMRRLELWFKWWEERIVHWGSLHLSVSLIPSTYSTSTCKDVLLYIEFIVSLRRMMHLPGSVHKFQTQIFLKVSMQVG